MMSGVNYVIYGCSSTRTIPGVSLYRSLTLEEKYCYSYYSINQLINQSINQSINVFEGKTQTVQLTNIFKHILFLLMIILMIIAIMKTVEPFE